MKKKLPVILLFAILLFAAYLRLYRIGDYMTFLGDEGRDVTIASQILNGHLTLLGPRSSAGNFFYGPIYYYMIAPFLFIFRYDPVGPAVMVALFSVATDYLLYFVGKRFFNDVAGLTAAALFAVSPLVITYSHSSWNPDVLPFFSILLMYVLYKSAVSSSHAWKYILVAGLILGIGLQLHYLATLLGVVTVIYLPVIDWYTQRKIRVGYVIKQYAELIVGFLIGFSPFIAFEIRHGFPNTKAIISFIFSDSLSTVYATHTSYIASTSNIFFRTFSRLVFDYPTPDRYSLYSQQALQLWSTGIVILAILAIVSVYYVKNKYVVILMYLWLFGNVLLFGLYKGNIYDYLFTFIFPLPFLYIGNLISAIYTFAVYRKKRFAGIIVSALLFVGLFGYNVADWPFRFEPNRQKQQAEDISQFVISKTGGRPYNFALLATGDSDYAYRYYLNYLGDSPVVINNPVSDPQRISVTSQLLIVCEDIGCKPLGNPFFDVAAFGRAQVAGEWNYSVVKVYRLVHYSGT